MKRRVDGYGDSVTGTNSIAVISDHIYSWISSCGWARGDSEHDRGTSQSTVSCRHDDVGGKVWRAVTTLSISFGPQLNLYDQSSYRPDSEESSKSSSFSCLSIVTELLTTRETDGQRVPSATTRWPISDFVSVWASATLCRFLFAFSFLFLHIAA